MTDRISAFTVFLTKDIREDDAEAVASALRMVKGVMRVKRHVADPAAAWELMRRERISMEPAFSIEHGDPWEGRWTRPTYGNADQRAADEAINEPHIALRSPCSTSTRTAPFLLSSVHYWRGLRRKG
jgi:hypothetical protein